MHIVVQVEVDDAVGAADHGGLVEPVVGQQLILGHAAQHMLGQGQHIAAEVVHEGIQRHGPLGGDGEGLVVDDLHAVDAGSVRGDEAVVAHALNGIHAHAGVAAGGVGHAQKHKLHVLGGHGLAVGPGGLLVQVDGEGQVVLGGDAVSQLGHKLQLLVQLHQGQEGQGQGVLDHFLRADEQGIHGGDGAGCRHIDGFGLLLRQGHAAKKQRCGQQEGQDRAEKVFHRSLLLP